MAKYWGLLWGGAAVFAYYSLVRPRLLTWGLTPEEAAATYVGDDIILHAQVNMTHAVEMNASPPIVWRWLAQMGQDHAGFYAFDGSMNRGIIESATILKSHLLPPEVGTVLDNGWKILHLEPEKSLVMGGFGLSLAWGGMYDVTHAYILKQLSPTRTRLLWRMRLHSYGLPAIFYGGLIEPWYFIYAQMQLQTLATRATRTPPINPEKVNGHRNKEFSL